MTEQENELLLKTHVLSTPKHLVELYQASFKENRESVAMHIVLKDDDFDFGPINRTPLEVSNFLKILTGEVII